MSQNDFPDWDMHTLDLLREEGLESLEVLLESLAHEGPRSVSYGAYEEFTKEAYSSGV